MRHLKMMGLAAIAVFALVAFAGATTASATKLCGAATATCASPLGHTTITADLVSGTNAVLTTSGGIINPTLTCSSSGVTVTATAPLAGDVALPGHLTGLSFTSCTSTSPTGCEPQGTVSGLPTSGSVTALATVGNGTLTLTPPTVSFSCPILGSNVVCSFGGSGTVDGTFTGSATDPTVDIVNQSIASTGGGGCPTASNWNARYTVTNPKPLFVTTN